MTETVVEQEPVEKPAVTPVPAASDEQLVAMLVDRAGRRGRRRAHRAVRAQLIECGVVGFDETGTRIAGRTCWVHTACTKSLTLYQVHAKRGVQAFGATGVLPLFGGIAVHDGWKPYKTCTGAAHALCNAHYLRELAAVAENAPAGRVPHPARAPGGPRRKRSKAANLLDRLDTERDQVLRFAFDWRVPFDNNTSEQAIRMAKIQQKISGGWRTVLGAEPFFAVRGHLSTAAKQGKNLLDAITRLFDGRGAWIPTPA